MRGEVTRPDVEGGDVTHVLRKDLNTTIRITDVYYAVPGRDRKGALEALIQI
jgi:hypothetical protein